MSTFASSVINKTGKKLSPKAPLRRVGPQNRASSSGRANSEQRAPIPPATASVQQQNHPADPPTSVTSSDPLQTNEEAPEPSSTAGSIDPLQFPSQQSPAIPTFRGDESAKQSDGPTLIPLPSSRRNDSSPPPTLPEHDAATPVTNNASLTPTQPSQKESDGTFTQSNVRGAKRPVEIAVTQAACLDEPAYKRRRAERIAREIPITQADSVIDTGETAESEEPTAEPAETEGQITRLTTNRTRDEDSETGRHDGEARVAEGSVGSRKKRRFKRMRTPENAETIEITPTVMKMAELCKDTHTGKKSEFEKGLQKKHIEEIKKRKEKRRELPQANSSTPQPTAQGPTAQEPVEPPPEQSTSSAPKYVLVNGIITIDSSSLQVDRHAELATQSGVGELIEENQYTNKINSASFLKKTPAVSWNDEKTSLFYRGLRMFGTDFAMVARLFPDRPRRSVKLKFTAEERKNPEKIKRTLLGPREQVDLTEFSLMTNTVYDDPSVLEKKIDDDRRRIEQQHARELEDREAEDQDEVDEYGSGSDENGSPGEKENQVGDDVDPQPANRGQKSTKTKARNVSSIPVGEEEIVGTIERDHEPVLNSIERVTRRSAHPPLRDTTAKTQNAKASSKKKATGKAAPATTRRAAASTNPSTGRPRR